MEPLATGPQSLGDLVGTAFRLVRRNAGLYWKALLVPAMLSALGSNLAQYSLKSWVQVAAKSQLAVTPFAIAMSVILVCIVVWFYAAWEMCLRCSAMARLLLGVNKGYQEAYARLKQRGWAVFGAYNLAVLPPLLVLMLWAVVAVAAVPLVPHGGTERYVVGALVFGAIGFFLTVSIAITSLYGAILMASAAVEDKPFKELLAKSLAFTRARPLRGGSYICLLTTALVLVSFAISSPVTIASIIHTLIVSRDGVASSMDSAEDPAYLQVVGAGFDVVLNMVTFAVAYTGYVLFYRDLKLRLEGSDLEHRLVALAGPVVAGNSGVFGNSGAFGDSGTSGGSGAIGGSGASGNSGASGSSNQ